MENRTATSSTLAGRPAPDTLVVDTLVDESDGSLAAGDVSLREALAAVKAGGTITFADELANQDAGFGEGVLGLTLGELVVDKSVSIEGLGAEALTISGNGQSRVFRLDDGNDSVRSQVTMAGLAIANGVGEQAGGILTAGESLIFSQGYLTDNTGGIASTLSPSGEGSGPLADILIQSSLLFSNQDFALSTQGKLTLSGSRIIGTKGVGIRHVGALSLERSGVANSQGRGIVSNGSLQLLSSQIESNTGDGIKHVGQLLAQDASITGNQGDGIISVGELQIANSQISSNTLSGVVINDTMVMVDSSIANNGENGVAAFATNSDARITAAGSFITGNGARDISRAVRDLSGSIPAVIEPIEPIAEPVPTTPDELPKLRGTRENDRIFGSDVGELIRAWNGRDFIDGKGGDDNIQGGIGDDRIKGGTGDDVLGGGKGRDRLSGGKGRDRFTYSRLNEGGDTITDFTVGEDLIDLSAIFNNAKYTSPTPFEEYVHIGSSASNRTKISVLDIDRTRPGKTVYREIALLNGVSVDGLDASSFAL